MLLWKATLTQLAQWYCSMAFRTAQGSGHSRRAARLPALLVPVSCARALRIDPTGSKGA